MVTRILLLALVATAIPACSGDSAPAPVLGWGAPAILPDMNYPNGHPLTLSTPQDAGVASLEDQHYAAVNQYRTAHGLPQFARDLAAEALARAYSKHMPIEPFFSHTDPEGETLFERAARASGHVPYVGLRENLILTNDPSPANVMALLLASPAHKANLDAPRDVNALGIGIWFDGTVYYITQEFFFRYP